VCIGALARLCGGHTLPAKNPKNVFLAGLECVMATWVWVVVLVVLGWLVFAADVFWLVKL
jgi:hypothetical protein